MVSSFIMPDSRSVRAPECGRAARRCVRTRPIFVQFTQILVETKDLAHGFVQIAQITRAWPPPPYVLNSATISAAIARALQFAGWQADGACPRVAAAAVPFADARQVVPRLRGRPRVRAHRNPGAETRGAHRHRVHGLREQVVGDEPVVAFHICRRCIQPMTRCTMSQVFAASILVDKHNAKRRR